MVIDMTDVSVGIMVDDTQANAILDAQMERLGRVIDETEKVKRKVLYTVSRSIGLINQGYSVLKQFVNRTGSVINPMFDIMFNTLSAMVSTAISGALMWMATGNPILIAFGLSVLVLSLELQLKSQSELAIQKAGIEQIYANMRNTFRPTTQIGVSF
jgi:hypothetical protein